MNKITVAFDKAIDPASFTPDDVSMSDPEQVKIKPVAVTRVSGTGNTQFSIEFSDQSKRGTYLVKGFLEV